MKNTINYKKFIRDAIIKIYININNIYLKRLIKIIKIQILFIFLINFILNINN